jgi:hypothetical protein
MGLPERVWLAAFVFLASDPEGSQTRIEQGLVFHFVSWLNLLTTAAGLIWIVPAAVVKRLSQLTISMHYMNARHKFETGSLSFTTPEFGVSACFFDHACLGVLSASATDAMCYQFNEEKQTWHPWGLKSEVQQCT